MTFAEEKQIDDFLILNRLPLDIMLEVRDHMISQVSDLQINENLSFERAFFKTKIAWEPEFKMTKYSIFYAEAIPVIFKKIAKAKYLNILKKALIIAAISSMFNLLFIYISPNLEVYKVFFKIQNLLFLVAPILLFVLNYKIRNYLKADYKYQGKLFYSIYQKNMGLMVISIMTMAQNLTNNGQFSYLFLKTDDQSHVISLLITMILPFIAQTFVLFGMINFLEHKKTLEKIQNFIKVANE